MKNLYSIFISCILILSSISFTVSAKATPPSVSADGAVIMDATTGQILYSKNMDSKYPPASTTKIMTALLTLENCKLDDVVKVGKKPPLADGSKIYIFEDEELTVRELLYALLIESANDCAEALAEHIAGSVPEFAKMMNSRAKELGCTNTNFVNPSGLYDDNHRTSAKDLSLIMRELVNHPEFTQISTTVSHMIEPTNKCKEKRPLWNKNKLVQKGTSYYYDGIEGGKTGYTIQSQHSYIAVAKRNDQRLIVTLLHDSVKTFFDDSRKLLDYGFNNFELVHMFTKDGFIKNYDCKNSSIPMLACDDFYYIKEKQDSNTAAYTLSNKDLSNISFKKNDIILTADISLNGNSIGTINLKSGVDHIVKTNELIPKSNKLLFSISLAIIVFVAIVIVYLIRKKLKIVDD